MPTQSLSKRKRPLPISFKNSPSMTKRSFLKDADINNIMDKYTKTGVLPSGTRSPMFGDFSSGDDYLSLQNKLVDAQANFLQLPSDVRELFDNDVANLLDFASDPANAEELQNLLGNGIDAAGEQPASSIPSQPDIARTMPPQNPLAPTDPSAPAGAEGAS